MVKGVARWICVLAAAAASLAQAVLVPAGLAVRLELDQDLSSKYAKAGDRVRLRVAEDVKVGADVVIAKGTRVLAVVAEARPRGRWGKNGVIRLALLPVPSVGKESVPLQPRQKGKEFQGSQTDKAALATGGGLVLLGPLGLLGGAFVPGKDVQLPKGSKLETEVARDTEVTLPERPVGEDSGS
ncbi:MAG: hypothetical protein N2109_07260 [Fimbriimonadales bacterium]|nr:hypothetical protein [Fimbriimonadales bacterium]